MNDRFIFLAGVKVIVFYTTTKLVLRSNGQWPEREGDHLRLLVKL